MELQSRPMGSRADWAAGEENQRRQSRHECDQERQEIASQQAASHRSVALRLEPLAPIWKSGLGWPPHLAWVSSSRVQTGYMGNTLVQVHR